MKWRQAFGWLAIIAAAASSAAAQDGACAASAVTNENGMTTVITAGPAGGATFTKTGTRTFTGTLILATKATYLGVATSPPPEALADQLKLAKGFGLLVEFVDAKSPAAAAGIRKNDVLTKLDDQLLTSPQHLGVLVRVHKPKDKVAVTLIREAQEQKITAELGEADEVAGSGAATNIGWVQANVPPNMAQVFANRDSAWRSITADTLSCSDGEHSLTITTSGREKRLVAKDRDGNVLYSGPVNTEEQRKQVPPEILKKFQTIEQFMGVENRADSVLARSVTGGGGIFVGAGPLINIGGRGQPSGQSHTWSDDEHNLTVTTRERGKYLTVDNRNGAILWQGPIQTDEQRKAVPPEYAKKLEKMEEEARAESRGTVSLIEDGLTVTLTTDAGKQTVVAKDADGKVLFEGPVDTEDQRAKMPAKVRTMLEKLWKTCAAVWQSSQENP